jgi:hypothetical protein
MSPWVGPSAASAAPPGPGRHRCRVRPAAGGIRSRCPRPRPPPGRPPGWSPSRPGPARWPRAGPSTGNRRPAVDPGGEPHDPRSVIVRPHAGCLPRARPVNHRPCRARSSRPDGAQQHVVDEMAPPQQLHLATPLIFGRETVDSASGPASPVLSGYGRRVGGLGPGLTSDSADAVRAVLRDDLSAGPRFLRHPPAVPV